MGDTRTRAVARHEIAHLALGNWLGRTPLWLNEGLAEHRCRPFDHIDFLRRDYVGGLAGLERDWRRWLYAEAAPLQF